MGKKMRLSIKVLLTVGLPALLTTVLAVPAGASATAGQRNFAEQGKATGLSAAQIAELQTTVDGYLAKVGGTQLALNKIDLNGTATLYVALSGEDHPRSLAATFGAQATDPNCTPGADFLHFCAYRLTNFRGDQIDMFACRRYTMPWVGDGSWDNNQSSGTRARFYGSSGNLLYTTPAPHSLNLSYDWTPVFSVVNC